MLNLGTETKNVSFRFVSTGGVVLHVVRATALPGKMARGFYAPPSAGVAAYCRVCAPGLKSELLGDFQLGAWTGSAWETRVSVPLR